MSIASMFQEFLENLNIKNSSEITHRYGEITAALNNHFRGTKSKTANSLQVGSFGRYTAIDDVSDLDMIYTMPPSDWGRFKNGRQSALLQEARTAIKERYPATDIRGDGQVVVVSFTNHDYEILPAFENSDSSFTYPDTHNGGSWKLANPRAEISEISQADIQTNRNLRRLSRMIRAWKNKHGTVLGGLLIDTLAHKFLLSTSKYHYSSFSRYDEMVFDFFDYLSNQPNQDYYHAPGSNQRVYVKRPFQHKAKIARKLCQKAIDSEGTASVNKNWKKIFGRPFPSSVIKTAVSESFNEQYTWDNTEEFIEDKYPIDVKYPLEIDCDVSQDGYRENTLRNMIMRRLPLLPRKKLLFKVIENDVPRPYHLEWKVLNRGEVAKKRNEVRGQIVFGSVEKVEHTKFRGEHLVECYAIKNNIVVARAQIDVPIQTRG